MMAGVDDYDPTRPNENPWVDDNLDNDDDDETTTTTSFPSEGYKDPITIENIQARLNALGDVRVKLDNSKIPTVENVENLAPAEAQKMIQGTKEFLRARFPNIDLKRIGTIRFGVTKYPNRIVAVGDKGGETPIFKIDGKGFMQEFLTSRQRALGPKAEAIIAQQNAEIRAFREQQRAAEARVENIEMEDLGMKRKQDELKALNEKLAKGEALVEQMENDDDDDGNEDSNTPLLTRKQQLDRQKQLNENYRHDRDKLQTEIAQTNKTRAQKVAQEKEKEAQLQTQISASENTRDTLEARLNTTKSLDDLRERDADLEKKNDEDQKSLMMRTQRFDLRGSISQPAGISTAFERKAHRSTLCLRTPTRGFAHR